MEKKFPEYKSLDLSQVNKDILKTWEENKTFEMSLKTREGHPSFVFYEGPPSANGMPGIHHVMARTIKDVICRYKTLQGFYVERKAGWDTHGLPVELGVEKKLGITKEAIGKSISVADYNKECREDVMKFTREWEELTQKMGYWVDMHNPYITYDNRYIETLWFLLQKLYNKGFLYKGYTIQPYSPAAGTGLSTHELNQPGCYRDVKDTTCVAQFKIVRNEVSEKLFKETDAVHFIAWTTTPWTLPSNTALAVGPAIHYLVVKTYNPYTFNPVTVVLAKDRFNAFFNPKAAEIPLEDYQPGEKLIPYKITGEFKGSELEGIRYEQLLPWMRPEGDAFRVITGDYVSTEDGTGIVHIAPTFGADDDRVAKIAGIAPMLLIDKEGNKQPMVDKRGRFYLLEEIDPDFLKTNVNQTLYQEYAGRFVKNAYDPNLTEEDATLDVDLAVMLKKENKAFKVEKHVHSYPHCWRTDKPVLYYPLDSWFIRTTAVKERMLELNRTINWKPASTGEGRFGKWLENLVDWNLSRSRYWGTPLPIWVSEDGSEQKCIGSVKELIAEIDKSVKAGFMSENPYKNFTVGDNSKENYDQIDLHRPYVDNIILVSSKGEKMIREKDLIDVWFDSGAMPYAQLHYPFEHQADIDEHRRFPADFIAEGVDQTRGWFFTLHAIATMAFDSVAFKNIISNGLVLDAKGNKMSKRLGNAVDPFTTIEQFGSDPLRWYMITNSQPWDNLKFDIAGVDEVKRKFFGTLYNTYGFFALYANVDHFHYAEAEIAISERPEIDRWILSLLNSLIKEVTEAYEKYEPTRAGRAIQDFVIENLSNWYVRLSRKRYWGGEYSTDKISAYQTLYTCLETVALLAAPIAPFYMEQLFTDLNKVSGHYKSSVHLAQFPTANESLINTQLEERMQLAQQISSMVLGLRRKVQIRVRQPLSKLMIPLLNEDMKHQLEAVKHIILSEVNVKAIEYITDTSGVLIKKIKPNFKTLGPKYGKYMKQISAAIAGMNQNDIFQFEKKGEFQLQFDDETLTLGLEDVEILSEDIPGWLVANEGKVTVALDINITKELKEEGIAREFINRIQNLRKESNFDVTDKIRLYIGKHAQINEAVENFSTYIASQVLAESVNLTDTIDTNAKEVEIDDMTTYIKIEKV
ncbi:isoleucine--tRNA ligase [Odoribacter laneus]|jgi:isoleucine--tRNA ligase|uniref:Isoleucine--tRNA ligase n=1 Tax=Odoribacter laneus YIT 12061 TaxID=742817 RepID=H1DKE1_9BACT|nr:isoleucine--tRNA ligase [Odoribacter laneus]EHP45755.1 isoleucine-tRNA ligase [Odoribacter laneus YIT 12061]GKI23247.1 isoleucine--tRNA ligase [Odoribacter laneus]GKI25347.1 isoleucine--tRNA ligase [Odoribacter laneus]